MKKYKIYVGGHPREIKRILSILFKLGYVFTPNRVRTMENVEKLWSSIERVYLPQAGKCLNSCAAFLPLAVLYHYYTFKFNLFWGRRKRESR